MTEAWRAEHARWCDRDLSELEHIYIRGDAVYVNVRLPDANATADRVCCP